MRRFLRDNGLSLVMAALFLTCWVGQAVSGWLVFNDNLEIHGMAEIGFLPYLASPHFLEATAENWESEFLQMSAYVALTACLFQRGSAESKNPDKVEDVDIERPEDSARADAPWPVRKGGWVLVLYRYSLSLAFALLFLVSFVMHALGGMQRENIERAAHGQLTMTLGGYMTSSQFWFEATQNWQSEFLAVLSIVVLSIFLRQKGSPESKPVAMPNRETP